MAIEIRKLPKWEEAKLDDKLKIIKKNNDSGILALAAFIGVAVVTILATLFEHTGELKENLSFLYILIIWSVGTLILSFLYNVFETKKVK